MQLLLDFLPVLLFFGAYVVTDDFFTAITVLVVAAPIVFIGQWLMTRKVNKVSLISTALVVVLGALSLVSENKAFIIWKPTVLYWGLAAALLVSEWVAERPLVRVLMSAAAGDESLQIPDDKWATLNRMWAAFFVFAGILNIYVAYTFSEATWVKFKLFGLLGLTFLFVVAQAFWMVQFMEAEEDASEEAADD